MLTAPSAAPLQAERLSEAEDWAKCSREDRDRMGHCRCHRSGTSDRGHTHGLTLGTALYCRLDSIRREHRRYLYIGLGRATSAPSVNMENVGVLSRCWRLRSSSLKGWGPGFEDKTLVWLQGMLGAKRCCCSPCKCYEQVIKRKKGLVDGASLWGKNCSITLWKSRLAKSAAEWHCGKGTRIALACILFSAHVSIR